jgi:hypothetical protein
MITTIIMAIPLMMAMTGRVISLLGIDVAVADNDDDDPAAVVPVHVSVVVAIMMYERCFCC